MLLESKSCIYSAYYPLLYTGMDNAGDDKYPVHKCCGRMSGSPGCWVGVHSAKNPLPDLMDLTEGTLTGTAWNPKYALEMGFAVNFCQAI